MSLILDALRKSEHQRQRQAGPALSVVSEGRSLHRPPPWALLLGGLLVLNVVVAGAVLLTGRSEERAADEAVVTVTPSPAPVSARPATEEARLNTVPVQLPARPPREEVRPLTTEITTPPAARAPAPAPAPTATARTDTATTSAAGAAREDDARLPRFADMLVRGEINVPHMHLDIHVFSGEPAQRFVFINMRRYNEGDATQEGPRVERITPDGVVMEHQGKRFSLSRD
jgi:general secretion pathway protein B